MRRDFTAERLHDVLADSEMPICEHVSLSSIPVRQGWTVDFLPLRKGRTIYRAAKSKCFSRYWECVQCRYGGTETVVGFEARQKTVEDGQGKGQRLWGYASPEGTVLELVVLVKRDLGALLLNSGHGAGELGNSTLAQSQSSAEISRSSSWETHAVTGEKLTRFKEGWARWVGRLRLANEECGMLWLLDGLSRLATVRERRTLGYREQCMAWRKGWQ
jgi:hypothetical protein